MLSLSGEFLRCLTDVDSTFQSSKTTCLQLAADMMASVIDVNSVETGDLRVERNAKEEICETKGQLGNLLKAALNCDESAVFVKLAELVEIMEAATNKVEGPTAIS